MADTTRYRDDPSIEEAQHDGDGSPLAPRPTANSFFKRPLKIITYAIIILIFLNLGLLITNCVLLNVWDFDDVGRQVYVNRNSAIVLFVAAIVTIPTLLIELPILINIIIHIIMATYIMIFATETFGWHFPSDYNMCSHWTYDGFTRVSGRTKVTPACHEKMEIMRILMGVSAGVGILIGVLVIALAILRLVALLKSQFWKNKRISGMFSKDAFRNLTGVTIQLSFSIIPAGTLPVVVDAQSPRVVGTTGSSEQERLIET